MIKSNISEKIKKLEDINARGQTIDVSAALTAGVNAARGLMQFRIFNNGRDSNNESFGKYIDSDYRRERVSKGRQIIYKDLEFYGSLRRAIITATESSNKVVCIINNPEEANIAKYQEQQIASIRLFGSVVKSSARAKIFSLSDEERIELRKVGNAALFELFSNLLK